MSPKPQGTGGFQVARSKDTVYVRVVGLGTMSNSLTFQGFIDQMQKTGYRRFVVDLDACQGVDSTFMGILLGVACGPSDGLVVLNAGPHCRKQIESVGLDRVLKLEQRPADIPAGVILHQLPDPTANPVDRLKLVMKAHKALVRFDQRNEEKFGAFLRDLAKNLGDDQG